MNLFGHDAVDYSDSAASKGSQEKYLIFVAPTIFWASVQLLLIRSDFKAMVIVMFTKLKMVRRQISDPVHGGGDGDLKSQLQVHHPGQLPPPPSFRTI